VTFTVTLAAGLHVAGGGRFQYKAPLCARGVPLDVLATRLASNLFVAREQDANCGRGLLSSLNEISQDLESHDNVGFHVESAAAIQPIAIYARWVFCSRADGMDSVEMSEEERKFWFVCKGRDEQVRTRRYLKSLDRHVNARRTRHSLDRVSYASAGGGVIRRRLDINESADARDDRGRPLFEIFDDIVRVQFCYWRGPAALPVVT
jgi:hypothetical protein